MALDHSLSELLTEYKNLAESDQENLNFIGSIIKTENAAIIFGALSLFEVKLCKKLKFSDLISSVRSFSHHLPNNNDTILI